MATLVTFPMVGHRQDEPFKAKVLTLAKAGSAYNIVAYTAASREEQTKSGLAHGWYDFVVLPASPEVCWVRREYTDRLEKYKGRPFKDEAKKIPRVQPYSSRGHSSIAEGKDVLWAGKLYFTGGPVGGKGQAQGTLKQWCNTSGHYMKAAVNYSQATVKQYAESQTARLKAQDGSRLLPMELFRPWDGDM